MKFTFPNLTRGEDKSVLIEIGLTSGTLLGCDAWLTIKERLSQRDDEAVLQLSTLNGGISVVDATHLRATFTRASTSFLRGKTYFIDVRVRTQDGKNIPVEDLDPTMDGVDWVTQSP